MAKQKMLHTPKTASCTHNIFIFIWDDARNTNPMEDHQHHCHHHYHIIINPVAAVVLV